MNSLFADPRRRNLAILLGASLVILVVAAFALYRQSARTAPQNASNAFFPGLAAHEHQIARFHFVSRKGGTFDIVFKPARGWVIPQKNDFPAAFALVKRTVVLLEGMRTIEPKTARPEWLHYIGLDDPKKGGTGTDITVSDERGHAFAHFIVGKSEDIGDAGGAVGLYVRRVGETQSWLVRASSELSVSSDDWIDKTVLDNLDPAAIQSTALILADGTNYEVVRAGKKDEHFKLAQVPAGREVAAEEGPDGVGAALTGFAFTDIKPAKDIDFSAPVRVTSRTFDGLSVTAEIAHIGTEYWAQLSAASLSSKPEIAKQARTINTRSTGWAYKLADYKGAQLTQPLESLLKPKGGGAELPPRPTP